MEKGKHRFLEIFRDNDGQMSTMRVLVCLIVVVVLFNWTWGCIATGTFIALSWQDLLIAVSPLFAKVAQKKYEGKE